MTAATGRPVSSGAGEEESGGGRQSGAGLSRAVIWTGIALGTALAILAMINGARLRIGGMPAWLGVTVGAVIVWALIVMAAITLAELTRRHHKTARRYAIRQGKRSALATGRTARRHSRALMAHAVRWAAPRWQARTRAHRPPDVGDSRARGDPRPGRQTGDRRRHACFQPAGIRIRRPRRPGRLRRQPAEHNRRYHHVTRLR